MCEDTFATSYRRDFLWPWDLPVILSPWPPPRKTCQRDLTCPPPPIPSCTCPHHSWAEHAGHYACLAEKESLIHKASQRVRDEIETGENRKKAEEDKKSDRPPLLRDDPKKSCYQIDYARKDVAEVTFEEMLAEIEAKPIQPGPLGRTLYGSYTDPTPMRKSYFTNPLYDKTRPVARDSTDIFDQYFNKYPGATEYMDKYSKTAVRTIKTSQKQKYPLPLIEYKSPQFRAITAE